MSDTTTPATDDVPPGMSQAAFFAIENAKSAAKEMLKAIRQIGNRNTWITTLALGVSMPHQIAFLLASVTSWLHWDSPAAWAESIGMLLLALMVPVGTDLYILNQITTVAARAAARSSKMYALITMIIPVGVSGTVNFMAPGPAITKWLAVWIVTLIPLAEAGRAFLRPDFAKIEAMEIGVLAQLAHTGEKAVRVEDEQEGTPAVDPRVVNKQRMLAAQKARELAVRAGGEISIAELMRATGCGRGAAKKAIELAREDAPESAEVTV